MVDEHDIPEPTTSAEADAAAPADLDAATEDVPGGPALDDSDAPVQLEDLERQRPSGMTTEGDLHADNVTINQGGARDIEATTVSITQGGAGRVYADELTVSQGGVGLARVEQLRLDQGGSAFAVMADKATVEEGGNVFLLVAGSVSGEARPLLDWRSALAAGAGLGVALALLRRIRR